MKSSAVKPGYVTIAICVMRCSLSSGEGFAVLVGRHPDASNKVAAHGFRGAEAAARSDRHHGVVGLLELSAGRLGADPFDVSAGRLADLTGEHPGEMAWAHRGAARQLGNAMHATGFGLDGILNGADRFAFGPGHPDRRGELRLPAGPAQV